MKPVNEIFDQGPEAVSDWFIDEAGSPNVPPMNAKELADICWTRASTLAKTQTPEAARWAKAALAGYEFLTRSSEPLIAESASENVAALRSWKILAN
jgi:hypothetical protein